MSFKKYKMLFSIFFVFVAFIFCNVIFGVDMETYATKAEDGITFSYTVKVYEGQYGEYPGVLNGSLASQNDGGATAPYAGRTAYSYGTYGITYSPRKLGNYTFDASQSVWYYYDVGTSGSKAFTSISESGTENKAYPLSQDNKIESRIVTKLGSNELKRTFNIKISEKILDELKEADYFKKSGLEKEINGKKYLGIYFSVVDYQGPESSPNIWTTPAYALSRINGWNPENFGRKYWPASGDNTPVIGGSVFNAYDNILYIPEELVNDKTVIPRYHYILNGKEVETITGNKTNVSNGFTITNPNQGKQDYSFKGYVINSTNPNYNNATSTQNPVPESSFKDGENTIDIYYNKVQLKVVLHYIDTNNNDNIVDDSSNYTVSGNTAKYIYKNSITKYDSVYGKDVEFGYFGASTVNCTVSGAPTSWRWDKTFSNNEISVTPSGNGTPELHIYYAHRDVYEHFVNGNNEHIAGTGIINSYPNNFSGEINVSRLPSNISNSYIYFNSVKYKYYSLRTTTQISKQVAESDIKNKTFGNSSLISVRIPPMNTSTSALNNGGDYSIVQYKMIALNPSEVYVRHLVETNDKENYLLKRTVNNETKYYKLATPLANTNQTIKHNTSYYKLQVSNGSYNFGNLIENKNYAIVPNGYNQRNEMSGNGATESIPANYSEYYKIDDSDILTVEKSRTIYSDGIRYDYYGYATYHNSADAAKASFVSYNNDPSRAQYNVSGNNTVTYIDFFYEPQDVRPPEDPDSPDNPNNPGDPNDPNNPETPDTPPIEPGLNIDTENDGGESISKNEEVNEGDCRIAYVPVTEYVRPYVVTKTSSPYTLIYEVTGIDQNGNKSYSMKQYDAYELNGAYVTNSSDTNKAKFLSTENEGVVNQNENLNLVIENFAKANSTIGNFSSLDPKDQGAITAAAENIPVTSKDNYMSSANKKQITSTKFNGIRTPKGVAIYNVVGLVGANAGNNIKTGINIEAAEDNTTKVNVYTPLAVDETLVKTDNYVDHSVDTTGVVIQKNANFEVTPRVKTDINEATTLYKNIPDASKYLQHYWLVIDFDITNLRVYDAAGNVISNPTIVGTVEGSVTKANSKIYVPKGGKISGVASSNQNETGDAISQAGNNIKVIAVTLNANDALEERVIRTNDKLTASSTQTTTLLKLIANSKISSVTSVCDENITPQTNHNISIDGTITNVLGYNKVMEDDSLYYVQEKTQTVNIGRIYDFKVTDCLDVNFKNVFRKSTDSNVNELTGVNYFSGLKRLLVYGDGNNAGSNVMYDISESVLNKVPTKAILPLGPNKHTDTGYVQAPKLGYRISFDLKTTGTYNANNTNSTRYIEITPSYYYISKDGQNFNDNITLYYKNSSGKYVKFEDSNYSIYFKPNNGYRSLYNKDEAGNLSVLSTKLEKLQIGSSSFKLNNKMMSYSDNNFIQAWYGEFKLPNSTIAVPTGGDLNNPLTDGYIGVKFKIVCVDEIRNGGSVKKVQVSYNQNDRDASKNEIINTTQWDYESFIGVQSGKEVSTSTNNTLRIQLEKGTWVIDNQDEYMKMKGTVILYDTDNRAANDFD